MISLRTTTTTAQSTLFVNGRACLTDVQLLDCTETTCVWDEGPPRPSVTARVLLTEEQYLHATASLTALLCSRGVYQWHLLVHQQERWSPFQGRLVGQEIDWLTLETCEVTLEIMIA